MVEIVVRIQAETVADAMKQLADAVPASSAQLTGPQDSDEAKKPKTGSKTKAEVKKVETPEPEVQPEPEAAEPSEPTETTEKEIKREDVRAVLAEVRTAGGDIKPLIDKYGGHMSKVKPEDFAALKAEAEKALAEIKGAA